LSKYSFQRIFGEIAIVRITLLLMYRLSVVMSSSLASSASGFGLEIFGHLWCHHDARSQSWSNKLSVFSFVTTRFLDHPFSVSSSSIQTFGFFFGCFSLRRRYYSPGNNITSIIGFGFGRGRKHFRSPSAVATHASHQPQPFSALVDFETNFLSFYRPRWSFSSWLHGYENLRAAESSVLGLGFNEINFRFFSASLAGERYHNDSWFRPPRCSYELLYGHAPFAPTLAATPVLGRLGFGTNFRPQCGLSTDRLLLPGGRVGHNDVDGPVDDVEQHECGRKDAPSDLIYATSLPLANVRVYRSRLAPSPQVLTEKNTHTYISSFDTGRTHIKLRLKNIPDIFRGNLKMIITLK